ncbi:hypothetical protein BDS110ZK17_24480 [Bradyrhizobium diazoefficiens]|nr:hypothetical protein XF16B_46250 [Bradyrhizobium diazoefficiens]BCF70278.1 hypothetical protein XF19B_46310 [Bradyrhizobium diazoefficiens]
MGNPGDKIDRWLQISPENQRPAPESPPAQPSSKAEEHLERIAKNTADIRYLGLLDAFMPVVALGLIWHGLRWLFSH